MDLRHLRVIFYKRPHSAACEREKFFGCRYHSSVSTSNRAFSGRASNGAVFRNCNRVIKFSRPSARRGV
jgi:hypothetical protein